MTDVANERDYTLIRPRNSPFSQKISTSCLALKAHVYKIYRNHLDCVHAPSNAPVICMHNKKCKKYYNDLENNNNNNEIIYKNAIIY